MSITTKTLRVTLGLDDVGLDGTVEKLLSAILPALFTYTGERLEAYEATLASSAANEAVNLHSIGTVRFFAIYASKSVTVKLDSEATGHTIGTDGGVFALSGDITGATVTNNAGEAIDFGVVLIGNV
jgi:hypothetical protein